MYNLLIGCTDGRLDSARMLEFTQDDLKAWFTPSGNLDVNRLRTLPTLLMPELQDSTSEQLARLGHVEDITWSGRTYRFRFVPNPAIPAIDTARIVELAYDLRIEDWEFSRTHWAVKDVDVYRAVAPTVATPPAGPTVFRLPTELPVERDLVAVMMPFAPQFAAVYGTLKSAAEAAGMHCSRADDIWLNDHIIDDIINLLWRANVIIADLTGKNANVFYETGIAHALGKRTILITQAMSDVPFDLQSVRTLTYLNNDEGRGALQPLITNRLRDLSAQ